MTSVPWPGPRRSVEDLAARHGRPAVVAACVGLLSGEDVEAQLVVGLGGPPARWALDGGAPGPDYWLRVWALRGLLWLWDDTATAAVTAALGDEAWRVREMALKVVARHGLDAALAPALLLREDPVLRVRAAAERAVARVTAAGGDRGRRAEPTGVRRPPGPAPAPSRTPPRSPGPARPARPG